MTRIQQQLLAARLADIAARLATAQAKAEQAARDSNPAGDHTFRNAYALGYLGAVAREAASEVESVVRELTPTARKRAA